MKYNKKSRKLYSSNPDYFLFKRLTIKNIALVGGILVGTNSEKFFS
jgi:hypothetical protein